jgi:post-segregation antitoxin (ccd killing protein)
MTIEAMKQALEALEMYLKMDTMDEAHILEADIAPKAITALRTAIEQANACEERWSLGTPSTCPDLVTWDASGPIVTIPHPAFKKPWAGLTDEDEIPWDGVDAKSFARAIEAKLKEKNT